MASQRYQQRQANEIHKKESPYCLCLEENIKPHWDDSDAYRTNFYCDECGLDLYLDERRTVIK